MDPQSCKDQVVAAMLSHAAFDGWSRTSMEAAGAELGMDSTQLQRLFPRGVMDAVAHLVDQANRAMLADLEAIGLEGRGVGERVFLAVKLRLGRWSGHKEAIRRATSLLALPQNLPLAARLTWGTADAIWLAAGDNSHDFSWYTRRASLAAVYSATLLYWLDDESEGDADSWGFLRRRLGDVRNLPQLRRKVEGMLGGIGSRLRPALPRR